MVSTRSYTLYFSGNENNHNTLILEYYNFVKYKKVQSNPEESFNCNVPINFLSEMLEKMFKYVLKTKIYKMHAAYIYHMSVSSNHLLQVLERNIFLKNNKNKIAQQKIMACAHELQKQRKIKCCN